MSKSSRTAIDVHRADAAYRSFPSFEEWRQGSHVDVSRWKQYATLLEDRKDLTPGLLAKARDVAKRAAAVDTGAIEGLYEVDRGFTFSVALQMAMWEAQLDAKGNRVRTIVEAQMSAYDFVLDFATQKVPIAEAWIRKLHEVMCAGQETYTALTEIGFQEQRLPLGQYKVLANHVLKADGQVHSYAPVGLVPNEMHRLCSELRSDSFAGAHPVEQAAYAHYALVLVHPFADGNGRVARALASVFTYRALSIPLVILAEHRLEYYDALAAADQGDYQPFTDFMLTRGLDSIQLVSETLNAAGIPAPGEAVGGLKRVYLTRGGFSHPEVDNAGYALFEAFGTELRRQRDGLNSIELTINYDAHQTVMPVENVAYRTPVADGARVAIIRLQTSPPAQTQLKRSVTLEVPRDSGKEDDLILRCAQTGEAFGARVTEAYPTVSGTLQLRLSVFVNGFLGRAIADVTRSATKILRENGY